MSEARDILVTGSTGFVGRAVVNALIVKKDIAVRAALRRLPSDIDINQDVVYVGDLDGETDWALALDKVRVVIHVAARVHIRKDEVPDLLAEYQKVNVDGTLNLARQAAAMNVHRFIFISTIHVNGTTTNRPFTEHDNLNPGEPYAQSKWEAEQGLWKLQQDTGMEIVILRPPLVYGQNAHGNFESLVRWVEIGLPLPLGAVHNKRSLVALDNLVDLIVTCIDHPGAANQTFLVSDGEDLSTTELLRGVAIAMGKPSRLLPIPVRLLQLGAIVLGKGAMAKRLLGSLQVDNNYVRKRLNWQPPLTVKQGLRRCFATHQD